MPTLHNFFANQGGPQPAPTAIQDVLDHYARLWGYYNNNDLYVGHGLDEAMRPLRTVVNRSVEFYVAKIFPTQGMEIEGAAGVVEAIDRISAWSNFEGMKPLWLREFSLLGDLFLKVISLKDKVYTEAIDPEYVTDFNANSRGYLNDIRIDIPMGSGKWYTEFWDKQAWKIWEHSQGRSVPLKQLGEPTQFGLNSQLGIDFVPIVQAKFKDVGDDRGHGCVDHAMDKIDEANRKATRLAQILFRYNKNQWVATSGGTGAGDIPAAPPLNAKDLEAELADDGVIALPYGDLKSLIPAINYEAALKILNADMEELERDLPELRYYSLTDVGQLSTKSITKILGAALDRANEARINFKQAVERTNEIGITMANFRGLTSVPGSYALGDFEHEIRVDSSFSEDIGEKAEVLKNLVDAGMEISEAMRLAGIERTVNGVVTRQMSLTVDLVPTEAAPADAPPQ